MKSAQRSTSTPLPSPQKKPGISSASETLTSFEIEQLQQDKRESSDYAQKAFSSKQSPKAA